MPGINFVGGSDAQKIGIVLVVAMIFGLVNAFIKPIVTVLSLPLYIVTLGLFHVVVNALMLWITAWITEHTTHWGLQIDHFWWTAVGGDSAVDRRLVADAVPPARSASSA